MRGEQGMDRLRKIYEDGVTLLQEIDKWIVAQSGDSPNGSSSSSGGEEVPARRVKGQRIEGMDKLRRRVEAEVSFLRSVVVTLEKPFHHAHANSSNLPRLAAVFRCVRLESGVCAVLKTFRPQQPPGEAGDGRRTKKRPLQSPSHMVFGDGPVSMVPVRRELPIEVDVVCQRGNVWVKVKAVNPNMADLICKGFFPFCALPLAAICAILCYRCHCI